MRCERRERLIVKLIDLVKARLDAKSNSYLAELPSLGLRDVRIRDDVVKDNERILTGGFYAEIDVDYDSIIAEDSGGQPFGIASLRAIQLSTRESLNRLAEGRARFTTAQWKYLLLRSVGFEPSRLTPREQDVLLLRMVPFVQRNFNMVELGMLGTGKSHLFHQVSPYAHLISEGRPASRGCSSTTPPGNVVWSSSTTSSASTRSPASPSTRRTAAVS